MRNMRIEFGNDRDAVIKELERMGYMESPNNGGPYDPEDAECNIIVAYGYGQWMEYCHDAYTSGYLHATLEDLKTMNKIRFDNM